MPGGQKSALDYAVGEQRAPTSAASAARGQMRTPFPARIAQELSGDVTLTCGNVLAEEVQPTRPTAIARSPLWFGRRIDASRLRV
jgi:hypothetical protein